MIFFSRLLSGLALAGFTSLFAFAGYSETASLIPDVKPSVDQLAGVERVRTLNKTAKVLFGARATPIGSKASVYGGYAKGCLAAGVSMPIDGPSWQVMRLKRNRYWGHPDLIDYVKKLAADAPALGWRGLLIGDLAQPRGGPMLTGHSSHQVGLDADIWLKQMPATRLDAVAREDVSAVSMLAKGKLHVDPDVWTENHAKLLRRAASDPRVARIFVHPGIKQALCKWASGDTDWLRRIRPWFRHHYHFHVRLRCPAGNPACINQPEPAKGTGCGAELTWWLDPEKHKPRKITRFRRELTMAELPHACVSLATMQ